MNEAVGHTHLSKAAFADDFEVVKITGFDPAGDKQTVLAHSNPNEPGPEDGVWFL